MPAFRGETLENLTLVIDSAPQIMGFAVDLHEDFVQVPAPVRIGPLMNAAFPYLRVEHRTEPVPGTADLGKFVPRSAPG